MRHVKEATGSSRLSKDDMRSKRQWGGQFMGQYMVERITELNRGMSWCRETCGKWREWFG